MRLVDQSPLIPAQELADLLNDQLGIPLTRIDPNSDPSSRPTGGKATTRTTGWKDYTVSS